MGVHVSVVDRRGNLRHEAVQEVATAKLEDEQRSQGSSRCELGLLVGRCLVSIPGAPGLFLEVDTRHP